MVLHLIDRFIDLFIHLLIDQIVGSFLMCKGSFCSRLYLKTLLHKGPIQKVCTLWRRKGGT